jgi:hypothetical protein
VIDQFHDKFGNEFFVFWRIEETKERKREKPTKTIKIQNYFQTDQEIN